MRTLIKNATIVNEGKSRRGSVVIEGDCIAEVLKYREQPALPCDEVIDAKGCCLLPGVIDDHVHFRDPGLIHKADILTESRAAAAGGVTSIMDMPNTNPQTITPDALERKLELLNERCIVNHSCYYGATDSNYTDFEKLDRRRVCGIKLFMGSSTGNMLVDKLDSLQRIFHSTDMLIAAHCEDQSIISRSLTLFKKMYKDETDIPVAKHSAIRSAAACYTSSALAVKLAKEANARLHLLHISTEQELSLLTRKKLQHASYEQQTKRITAEVCVSHLLFSQPDYRLLGTRIKCNPAIKQTKDRDALREAVRKGVIDIIATDHAPHLLSEKEGGATKAMSGMPMIQFSLISMLELADAGVFTKEQIVEKMCHAPARLFGITGRGYIRPGYKADLVLVRPGTPWELTRDKILSKCHWSPLERHTFTWKVEKTFANGHLVYDGETVDETYRGEELAFYY